MNLCDPWMGEGGAHGVAPARQTPQWYDALPCYLSVQDEQLRIVETNDLFRRDFEAEPGEYCYRAYKHRESPCAACPVLATFETGRKHTSRETVVTRDGEELTVAVTSSPLLDDRGQVVAVVEMFTDITEVERLQSLATVGLAVTGMAHRMKNILMGLKGGVFVVNDGFDTRDDASVQEGWGAVQRNVERMSRVAMDLLFCSKDREPNLEDGVCPEAIAQEVHDLYRLRAAADGIELRLEVGRSPHQGRFDAEALHSLMTNLVANALDACRFDPAVDRKEHEIVLRCSRDEAGATVVEVADNGAGIPADQVSRVLRGFFSTKGTEGTGLGLLVVQKVVEEHGGRFSFTTEEGTGTTFTVAIPARRDDDVRTGDTAR